MKHWEIVGYTYDADAHCVTCAEERFGPQVHDDEQPPEDSEGNEIHPMFAGDEYSSEGEHCGDCGEEIVEPYEDEDEYLSSGEADRQNRR